MKSLITVLFSVTILSWAHSSFAIEYGGYQDACPNKCSNAEIKNGSWWAECGNPRKVILNSPKSNNSGYLCWTEYK